MGGQHASGLSDEVCLKKKSCWMYYFGLAMSFDWNYYYYYCSRRDYWIGFHGPFPLVRHEGSRDLGPWQQQRLERDLLLEPQHQWMEFEQRLLLRLVVRRHHLPATLDPRV